MSEPTGDVEVLVAGAGPVGLTVAHELARRGVRVRIVDRAPGPAVTSRATATHASTLEVFARMGIAGRMRARGRRVAHFSMHMKGKCLIAFDTNYDSLPTQYPFSLMIDQVKTEEVLRESLAEHGVRIEWGVGITDFDRTADHVDATLTHQDGVIEQVRVPYLVGTDGARSTVRKKLGLRLLGDSMQTWLNADVFLETDLPADSNHLLHCGNGTLLLVPFPEEGRWRIVDTEDVSCADDPEALRSRLEAKIKVALRRDVKVSTPTWISVFTVQQRMIERMQEGRCFLAGDAAHVHSPASGQGMNTGIQDGYNLAWKLADVVQGRAGERLLLSYTIERGPIGEKLLKSTRVATALIGLRNVVAPVALPVGMAVLRTIKPLKRKIEGKIIRGFCGLALHYPVSPLTIKTADTLPGFAPGERVGCSVETAAVSPAWRDLLGRLTDTRWTLLAFAAAAPEAAGVAEVAERYSGSVQVRTAGGAGPDALDDAGDHVRRAFGLMGPAYALIRPDGYLAAKGPLTGAAGLIDLLTGLQIRPHGAADRTRDLDTAVRSS